DRDSPGQRAADRSLGAATEQLEGRVQPGYRGSLGQHPYGTTDREEPAKSDDEGGDADVGDDETLYRSEDGPQGDADRQRDEPAEGEIVAHAEDVRQPIGHQQCVAHRDEADQGADGEVDVAG